MKYVSERNTNSIWYHIWILKLKRTNEYKKKGNSKIKTPVVTNGKRGGEGQDRGRGFRVTNHYVQNKLQGYSLYIVVYTVQHREYSQYFIIITSGV